MTDRNRLPRGFAAARPLVVGSTVVLLVMLAGVCGWRSARSGMAQEAQDGGRAFRLSHVPRDAVALFATRPAELLGKPALAGLRDSFAQLGDDGPLQGLKPDDVTEFRLVVLLSERVQPTVAFHVQAASGDAVMRIAGFLGPKTESSRYGEVTYFRTQSGQFYFQPDGLSFVFATDEATLRRCILAGAEGASTTNWAEAWSSVAGHSAAAVVNTSLLRALPNLVPPGFRVGDPRSGEQLARDTLVRVSPLWQRSELAVAELDVSEQITLRVISQSASEENAKEVHDALLTAIAAGRLALTLGRSSAVESDDARSAALLQHFDLLDSLLEKAQVVRQTTQVGLRARADAGLAQQLAAMLLPAAIATRDSSLLTKSSNNLKKLAIAMHNYHDTYKVFPAATQIGPKNIPHSWRVTILPFIEQQQLYEEYRQDEPWDSEHNALVLARMPDIFRHPGDVHNSTHTSYFTLVGARTPFDGTKCGRFANILDGTSNTILLVEAKQATPWTRPEDIPYDPEQPLPPMGGWTPAGFLAAFCDGSVRRVPANIDPQLLRIAITRDDGQVLKWPK